eukprot:Lankesteria_metandrocarpae@DN5402_c2_g1_i4.p1
MNKMFGVKHILVVFSIYLGSSVHHGVFGADVSASILLPAAGLPIDTSYSCMFIVKGNEEYTLLPTMDISNGQTVYQGVDNDTCEPLNRYLYSVNENWYSSDTLQKIAESTRIKYNEYIDGCDIWKAAPELPFGLNDAMTIRTIVYSPCVKVLPKPAVRLAVNHSRPCSFSVSGYEEYVLVPTTTSLFDFPVYQAVDKDTCEPLNRYLFNAHNTSTDWYLDIDYRRYELEGERLSKYRSFKFFGVGLTTSYYVEDCAFFAQYRKENPNRAFSSPVNFLVGRKYVGNGQITAINDSPCFETTYTTTASTIDGVTAHAPN